MTPTVRVNLGDFTKTPGGRYRQDYKFSGEQFYTDHIRPQLVAGAAVEVDLGTHQEVIGIPVSFMSEFTWRAVEEFGHDVRLTAYDASTVPRERVLDMQYHLDRAKSKLPKNGLGG